MITPKELADVMEQIENREKQVQDQFYEKYGKGAYMVVHPDFWREVALREIPEWLIPSPPAYIKFSENVPYGQVYVLRPDLYDPMKPTMVKP